MLRFRRIGRVAALGMLVFVALITQANAARDAIREFPHTRKCPATFAAIDPGGQYDPRTLTFEATSRSATLTFLACSDRLGNDVNLSLDHVMVVEKTLFDAKRLNYPDDVPEDYGVALWEDVGLLEPVCYGNEKVTSVFDRSAATPFSRAWPFYDDFEGPTPLPWKLTNCEIGPEVKDEVHLNVIPNDTQSRSLLLTRAGENTCASASIRIHHLVKTRKYVVDFSWFVSGGDFPSPGFSNSGPLVSVCVTPSVAGASSLACTVGS